MSGKFPDDWKIATVIPLPKVDNPKTSSELRPMSLLPIIGKIMEKSVHTQLKDYLEENNLLTSQQHGFRKNHSTQSACAIFLDDNNVTPRQGRKYSGLISKKLLILLTMKYFLRKSRTCMLDKIQ